MYKLLAGIAIVAALCAYNCEAITCIVGPDTDGDYAVGTGCVQCVTTVDSSSGSDVTTLSCGTTATCPTDVTNIDYTCCTNADNCNAAGSTYACLVGTGAPYAVQGNCMSCLNTIGTDSCSSSVACSESSTCCTNNCNRPTDSTVLCSEDGELQGGCNQCIVAVESSGATTTTTLSCGTTATCPPDTTAIDYECCDNEDSCNAATGTLTCNAGTVGSSSDATGCEQCITETNVATQIETWSCARTTADCPTDDTGATTYVCCSTGNNCNTLPAGSLTCQTGTVGSFTPLSTCDQCIVETTVATQIETWRCGTTATCPTNVTDVTTYICCETANCNALPDGSLTCQTGTTEPYTEQTTCDQCITETTGGSTTLRCGTTGTCPTNTAATTYECCSGEDNCNTSGAQAIRPMCGILLLMTAIFKLFI